jgi:2-succinyl-6-hydroxy-2,4-cyclohexadiene-1-carboxylate synthase
VIALHGFLGLSTDWQEFQLGLGDLRFESRDLWRDVEHLRFSGAGKVDLFEAWVELFSSSLMTRPAKDRPILMGYSMGGRLAMHAVVKFPERFSAAIFISANPGLSSEPVADEVRRQRQSSDSLWAERFRSDEWHSVCAAWNDQAVLRRSSGQIQNSGEGLESGPAGGEWARKVSDFDRENLAWALENWSLARQRDLRRPLLASGLPMLYLTGSEDSKFTNIISDLSRQFDARKQHRHTVIEGAGHRLPWDQPHRFSDVLCRFLNEQVLAEGS